MRKHRKAQAAVKAKSDWTKVGSCLYRYRGQTYYAVVRHTGKLIRRSLETTDRKLAERKLSKFKEDLGRTIPTEVHRTIDQHRSVYEPGMEGCASTVKRKKHYVQKFLEQWPKDFPREIRKITKNHLKAWLASYRREDRKNQGLRTLKPATINHLITEVRNFFGSAVDDGVVADNPASEITYLKVAKPKRSTPNSSEFEAIVANIRSQKSNGHGAAESADTVELAGRLGLGQAELAGIQRKHINLEAGTIDIFVRRKTQVGFVIPIYPLARPALLRRIEVIGDNHEARLLPNYNFRRALEGACSRLGLPKFEPRSLRRFFITEALRAGVDAPTIASWQGHNDGGALVLKVYGAAVQQEHSQRMAKRLAPAPVTQNVRGLQH